MESSVEQLPSAVARGTQLRAHKASLQPDCKRKRPRHTSLPVEVASKLLSPSFSATDREQLLGAMEAQRILEKHIAIFPLMKSRNHFCLIVLDIMWGHTSMTEFGRKLSSLHRANFASEPNVTKRNDPRDSGVLCCMLATQLAEGCSPVASEGDAANFRKQMVLKLDFAGRWRRESVVEEL
ncbi:hypothetical protein EAH_00010250 [Eimeria acervulina]|uniref:Uncharacterized protein n=1 Tax=Eimeria acervulina TaxID=5801 RepID=U6GG53_EIMAC|nr:hypothetical protein EAH_00010250 [Eimeria acervulina]CDI79236.1 hypothetical protein EAH_00010250 [Eimeria acervulina]